MAASWFAELSSASITGIVILRRVVKGCTAKDIPAALGLVPGHLRATLENYLSDVRTFGYRLCRTSSMCHICEYVGASGREFGSSFAQPATRILCAEGLRRQAGMVCMQRVRDAEHYQASATTFGICCKPFLCHRWGHNRCLLVCFP